MNLMIILPLTFLLGLTGCRPPASDDNFFYKRKTMVEHQIKARGIRDENVLSAMLKVKRHLFVPLTNRAYSYEDYPLPIGYDQTISQPYIVAYMTEAALLKPDDKVLEIGTGSGYQAAVLAEIVREVYSVEIIDALAQSADKHLKDLGYTNIFVKNGDGYQGWKEHAPFDVVIVTAAPDKVPQELINQMKVGGRMVIPVGSFSQELIRITKTKTGTEKEFLLPVRFVPMVKGKE
ncbi:MAG: protein-L-isoaspartate(D-aspartate) O-methyltransferase [Candidatus Omnitrophota bacterium]